MRGWLLPLAIGAVIGLLITVHPARCEPPHHSEEHLSQHVTVTSVECDNCGYENLHHYQGRKASNWHDADNDVSDRHHDHDDDADDDDEDGGE